MIISSATQETSQNTITVDTQTSTGEVMWGAMGWLYGLAMNTPSDELITRLSHPQITCQNPPDGLQHPDGYADKVAAQFKRCGGKRIDIYCPDIYKGWPYPDYGMNDYLSKLETIARKIMAQPDPDFFTYSIFNEPRGNWYGCEDYLTKLCNDWKLAYDKIKSIHPTAQFTGPGYAVYNSSDYRIFFTFCRDNNCLPDYVSWHELDDDFFSNWYNHYDDYRQIESDLAIGKREIVINEYARSHITSEYNDLGVPGNLIQFISRFENSKVYACLAYWTGHGTLNDLVANNNTDQQAIGSSFNRPTGAWYLYQWYGQMEGNTVEVNLPSRNGSLQALANRDGNKINILFGGASQLDAVYNVNIVVRSLSGNRVDYAVYETDDTGRDTANEPQVKSSGTLNVSNGQVNIPMTGCKARSAYKIFISENVVTATP